jgi:hypothetical protein
MMNRIRPRQKRSLRFEALEGRLVLSTGGIGVISPQAHVLVRSQVQAQRQVPASFRGHVSESGSTVTTTNLTGTIGRDHFKGSATGTTSGTIFQGGYVYLSNSKGSVTLKLFPATVTQVGKRIKQTVAAVALDCTGKYAQYTGSPGELTTWNVPARPNATASFSGVFTIP